MENARLNHPAHTHTHVVRCYWKRKPPLAVDVKKKGLNKYIRHNAPMKITTPSS